MTLEERVLKALFGPDLNPTPRGMAAVQIGFVLLGLAVIVLLAAGLDLLADVIVDPTP